MKKNILVILIVIGVVGVVLYLLKDRVKALLGERVEGEEMKEPIEDSAYRYRFGPLVGLPPDYRSLGLKPFVPSKVTMGVGITLAESPARWLQEEIAPLLMPLYPQRYRAIVKGLFAYLVKGETALPPDQEVVTQISPYHEPTGPYSWALPQF